MQTETLLDLWRKLRQESVLALEEFPGEALDEELIPGFMNFRTLHRHILDSTHVLTGLLLDGATEFNKPEVRAQFPKHLPVIEENAGAQAIAEALSARMEERISQLAVQPAEFWDREVVHFTGARMSAFEMMLMIQRHESEHRAQAALLSRMKGIVPATTRRRLAAQAR